MRVGNKVVATKSIPGKLTEGKTYTVLNVCTCQTCADDNPVISVFDDSHDWYGAYFKDSFRQKMQRNLPNWW